MGAGPSSQVPKQTKEDKKVEDPAAQAQKQEEAPKSEPQKEQSKKLTKNYVSNGREIKKIEDKTKIDTKHFFYGNISEINALLNDI